MHKQSPCTLIGRNNTSVFTRKGEGGQCLSCGTGLVRVRLISPGCHRHRWGSPVPSHTNKFTADRPGVGTPAE